MSYVVESASSRRARRRRRTAVTLLIVVAMLAGAFYVASSYWRSPPGPAANGAGCPTTTTTGSAASTAKPGAKPAAKPAAKAPSPSQVTVNVYNATNRSGLAGDTGKAVRARGFVVGAVANDPLKRAIAGTGEVRFGKNGLAAATVARTLLPSAKPVVDGRADASVDLVLGNTFAALAPAPPPGAPGATSPC